MFSVVIPLHNRERFIARAIDSVLAQTVEDFEVIVVDDGSKDSGPEIVEGYTDPRVKLVRQKNQGPGPARNKGIAEATHDYVAFLDSDDTWDPHRLQATQQTLEKFPQAAFMSAAYRMVYSPRNCIEQTRVTDEQMFEDNYLDSMLTGSGGCWTCTVTVRRDVANEIGGFPDIPTGQDMFFWLKISRKYPLYYYNIPTAVYDKTPHPHITGDPDLNKGRRRMEGFSQVVSWIESEMASEPDDTVREKLKKVQYFYLMKAGEGALFNEGLFGDFLELNKDASAMPGALIEKGNCPATRRHFKKSAFIRQARNKIVPLIMRFSPCSLRYKCVVLRRVPFDYAQWDAGCHQAK